MSTFSGWNPEIVIVAQGAEGQGVTHTFPRCKGGWEKMQEASQEEPQGEGGSGEGRVENLC